jgi:hypothetical protein
MREHWRGFAAWPKQIPDKAVLPLRALP